jgi:cytochrome c6
VFAAVVFAAFAAVCIAGVTGKIEAAQKSGEQLFKEFCTPCHPDGGNIVNPKKTLYKKDREANGIKTEEDIVKNMRNPGPGMTKFDAKIIPDKDAREIAKYILKTFN